MTITVTVCYKEGIQIKISQENKKIGEYPSHSFHCPHTWTWVTAFLKLVCNCKHGMLLAGKLRWVVMYAGLMLANPCSETVEVRPAPKLGR